VQTLLHLQAASSVVTGATPSVGYATDDRRDLVVRFDPRTGRVSATAAVLDRPAAMVRLGGDLWVAEAVRNTLIEVDARSLRAVRSVPVPAGPASLAVFRGDIWVTSVMAGEVTSVDPRTGTAGTPVDVPGGAVRVAAGFGALWVTDAQDRVHRYVPATARTPEPVLEGITVGTGPIGVATGVGSVWVANARAGTVSQVDPSTLRVVHTYRVGGEPSSVAVAGGRVYVGDGAARTVRTVYPAPASTAYAVGTTPRQLVPAGAEVWVAGADPGRVLAVGTR
jgi:YVTN family beta-propeller protein